MFHEKKPWNFRVPPTRLRQPQPWRDPIPKPGEGTILQDRRVWRVQRNGRDKSDANALRIDLAWGAAKVNSDH